MGVAVVVRAAQVARLPAVDLAGHLALPVPQRHRAVRRNMDAIIRGDHRHVAIAKITPNPWNYNEQDPVTFGKLVKSIRKHGFVQPVIVRRKAGGKLELINGEHRYRAALEVGLTEVPVIDLGKVPDDKAKELSILLNEIGGTPNEDKLSAILRELATDREFADLADVMPFDDADIARMLEETARHVPDIPDAAPSPASPSRSASGSAEVQGDDSGPGNTKWIKFKVAVKVHAELVDKITELGKDPNDVLVKAIRHYHRAKKSGGRKRKAE